MAKVRLNPLMLGISRMMANIVFRSSKNGETIISQRSRRLDTEPSEAQKARRERFKLANQYARAAHADPDLREYYEELAEKKGKRALALARIDYFEGRNVLSKNHERHLFDSFGASPRRNR